jgi:uracil-DNA glycosylase family 4
MVSCLERFTKEMRFADLVESVQHCNLCPRLHGRTKVLSAANGNLNSKVLFVAEAPGRYGADRTGVPLCGDRTGDNFEKLLGNIGWQREEVFITNAVLCNPREEDGNNATPTSEEIANCSAYLEMVITLVQPNVVVSLGTTALKALELISPHRIQLREGIAKPIPWYGAKLFPLYHPGPRTTVHRSLTKQRSDFMRLAKIVHPVKGLLEGRGFRVNSAPLLPEGTTHLQQMARALLENSGRMTYFKLAKLMYMADFLALQRLGSTVGSELYLRQVDGPWPPMLNKALRAMEGFEIRRYFARQIPMVDIGPSPRSEIYLADEILEIVAEISQKYGQMSNSMIKAAVYRSEPMRFILEEEDKGKDMRNKPVLYKDKTAADLIKK